MNIFIIGQCTLHWGRMEFGNIGNYYIIEPFVRELRRVFPDSNIRTTFQMSQEFCDRERIEVVPMELYYGWNKCDLPLALAELSSAQYYSKYGALPNKTSYIEELLHTDLVIDFSGDIWGDNANFLGEDRFLVGLCKDRVAQLLVKKTVMLAGSPGPFNDHNTLEFAKEVYEGFDLVTNREPISTQILSDQGFNISKTYNLSCPAFLFEPAKIDNIYHSIFKEEGIEDNGRLNVGFILCGWNFLRGPFDREVREDHEYHVFVEAIDHIVNQLNANVILLSHSNGFPIPPKDFKLTHGRDYPITKQLQKVLMERGISNHVYCLDGVYSAWETKSIIGSFDMLVSGRVHGAVAAISQNVPTVLIDYGHEPKAHKIRGFATVAGVDEYVADPSATSNVIDKIDYCFNQLDENKRHLKKTNEKAKFDAKYNFDLLKQLFETNL